MRSPLGGSIATCLIFVPLVAVPLLAVLGMPQLATSKAAATGDDLKFAADEANPGGGNADLLRRSASRIRRMMPRPRRALRG